MLWYILLGFGTVVSLWVAVRLLLATQKYRYRPALMASPSDDLPSVSVCIAARNEMHGLAQNLECVLASTYPKLEILVLDDASDDATPLIIKSFAHAGVRFIPGRALPAGWLGRNHAYQTLAEAASGDYILYLDVDTLLAPNTIGKLVDQLLSGQKAMLAVLPRREDTRRASVYLGSLRYAWELVFASRSQPPSSSALWMIERDRLLALDKSFGEYGLSIRPELHIAQQLQAMHDYRYLIASHELGLSYEKRWTSQVETATRLYLPMFGRSVGLIIRALLLFVGLLSPLIVGVAAIGTNMILALWSTLLVIVLLLAFGRYTYATHTLQATLIRLVFWPYLLIQEIILYSLSCYRYATRRVTWKGRQILAQPKNTTHYEVNE